jgi:hypothetical protein
MAEYLRSYAALFLLPVRLGWRADELRSRSLRTGGRPGERITARPVSAAAHSGGRPIENTSIVEVLRPPVEPGQYASID